MTDVPRRAMFVVGVDGHCFHEHPEAEACAASGCVEATEPRRRIVAAREAQLTLRAKGKQRPPYRVKSS